MVSTLRTLRLFAGFYFIFYSIFILFRVSIRYAKPEQYQKLQTHDSCIHNLELRTVHPNNPNVKFGSVHEVQS